MPTIVSQQVQRNEKVLKWAESKNWSPIEAQAAWEMFFFCCQLEPKLRGPIIWHNEQEG